MTKTSLRAASYVDGNPISLRELIINSFYKAYITFHPPHTPWLHLSSSLARRSRLALEPNSSPPPSKPRVSRQGSRALERGRWFSCFSSTIQRRQERSQPSGLCNFPATIYTAIYYFIFIYTAVYINGIRLQQCATNACVCVHMCMHTYACVSICVCTHISLLPSQRLQ